MFFRKRGNKWLPYVISAWKFEDDATDSIGSNDGTETSISYVTGSVSKASDYTAGTSSKIDVADDNTLSFGDGSSDSAFSVSVMMLLKTDANAMMFDKRTTGSGEREYSAWYDAGGSTLVFRLFDESTGGYIEITRAFTPTLDVWIHLIFTYDGSSSSSGITMYLNGVSTGSTGSSGSYTAMENGSASLVFGKLNSGTTFSLDGYLDDLILWNKELSASEASEIKTDQISGIDILA